MSSSSSQPQTHDPHSHQISQNQPYFGESTNNLDLFSDILFGQQATQAQSNQLQQHSTADYHQFGASNRLVDHSNSSTDTLVASTENTAHHFGSNDSIASSSLSFGHQQSAQVQSIDSDTAKKHFYDRSTPEDLGLLTLRSNSDPTIALHSLHQSRAHQQPQQQPQQPIPNVALTDISQNVPVQSQSQSHPTNAISIPDSSLPSFQDIYQIKYNQLETFGLKMDEDCYHMAQPQQNNMAYHHHGHGHNQPHPHQQPPQQHSAHLHHHQQQHQPQHQHVMHQEQFDYQPNNSQQFMSSNFYPYEQQSMVSSQRIFYILFTILDRNPLKSDFLYHYSHFISTGAQ